MRYWTDPRTRRWFVWGVLAGVFLLVNVHRLSTAVLAERLMRAFDATGVELGTLHAIYFYIYAFLQLPAGALVDRMGTRRTAAVGTAVMSAGVVTFAVSPTYTPAFAGRALIGFGGSVIYVSILRFGANWFRPDEFATINGLTVAVSGLGGVLATTPLAVAVAAVGWRSTFVALGLASLAIAGTIWIVVRDSPERAGLDPIDGVLSAPNLSIREVWANVATVLRDAETWVLGLLLFCVTGVTFTVFGLWGVPYVVQVYGVSVTRASVFTLLGSGGVVIGSPALGWLSDRLGRRTELMVAGGVVYAAAFAALVAWGAPPLWFVGLVFFLTGVLVGSFMLAYAVAKERHAASASGVATGTVNSAAFLGAAVLPTLMGGVLDAYWTGETVAGARVYTLFGYRVAFGVAAIAGVVALACSVWLHFRRA